MDYVKQYQKLIDINSMEIDFINIIENKCEEFIKFVPQTQKDMNDLSKELEKCRIVLEKNKQNSISILKRLHEMEIYFKLAEIKNGKRL